jgi:phosphate transport system protein
MTDLVARQLQAALDAYASRDARKAVDVVSHDSEVDAMHTSLFRELLTYMMEDPRNISQCIHLLFCTKSLERVGDHATNIAEAAYYLETGRRLGVEETQRQQL